MAGRLSRLTLHQKLALAAVLLGAVALFASPYPGSRVTLDAKALALVICTEAEHVEAPELAAFALHCKLQQLKRLHRLRQQCIGCHHGGDCRRR